MTDGSAKFALHEAARDGKSTIVESLLNANPRLSRLRDDDDRLPIHWAVSYGHLDVTTILTSQKDFDPDAQDGSGWTPLMIAASLKDGEGLVDIMLSKGADVNQTSASVLNMLDYIDGNIDFNGQTALHFVASKNNIDVARKLLSSTASTRVKDIRGQYAIHRAAAAGSVPILELLIKNRSPLDQADSAGQTPLHHAVAEGHGDAAVALLKAGAEFDKKDNDGFVALELAPDSQVRKFIAQTAEREGIEI